MVMLCERSPAAFAASLERALYAQGCRGGLTPTIGAVRPISELRDVATPAWPLIAAAIETAAHPVVSLPVDPDQGEETLVALQVTAASALGALALNTGGLVVDHGWLRILGGGDPPLNLAESNGLPGTGEAPGRLLVAFDVLGGSYAINGGELPGPAGGVCYFAPDELRWLPLEMGHGDFVGWAMTDQLAVFYEGLRWPGWEQEVGELEPSEGLSVYPFPFTREGRSLSLVSRRVAPIRELVVLWAGLAAQVSDAD